MVGQDGFASGCGEGVDGAERCEVVGAGGGVVGEEEDAARAGPELAEAVFGFEDVRGVGPEAAVPEAVDVAIDEVDLVGGVEDERGARGEFAVEDDEIVGLDTCLVDGEG